MSDAKPPLIQLVDAEADVLGALGPAIEQLVRQELQTHAPKALAALDEQVYFVAADAAHQVMHRLHDRLADFREEHPERYSEINSTLSQRQ